TYAADNPLQDRGDPEKIICQIDRQRGSRVEAGARHVGIDIVAHRWNAERTQIMSDERCRAGSTFGMRHMPGHQMIAEIRERIAERRQFPIEYGHNLRSVTR